MLEVGGSRYEYEMNMLLSAARFKIPMREMPIKTIYVDGNSGSYFNPIKDSAKIYFEIIKFCSVSLISFVIDFAAYALFTALLFSLPQGKSVGAANVAARILSASVNFMLNRKFVFDHKSSAAVSALKYAVTACIVLAANTFLLRLAVCRIGINKYAAKLIVEPIMFLFSWSAQHFFVFAKKRDV
jgi:putative flippase GtrA